MSEVEVANNLKSPNWQQQPASTLSALLNVPFVFRSFSFVNETLVIWLACELLVCSTRWPVALGGLSPGERGFIADMQWLYVMVPSLSACSKKTPLSVFRRCVFAWKQACFPRGSFTRNSRLQPASVAETHLPTSPSQVVLAQPSRQQISPSLRRELSQRPRGRCLNKGVCWDFLGIVRVSFYCRTFWLKMAFLSEALC